MSETESPKEWLGQVEFVAKNIQNFWTIGAAVAGVFVGVMFGLDFLIWTLNFNLDGATFWSVYFRGNPEGLWGYEIVMWLIMVFVLGGWFFVYVKSLSKGLGLSQNPMRFLCCFDPKVAPCASIRPFGHALALWFYVALGVFIGFALSFDPLFVTSIVFLLSPIIVPWLAKIISHYANQFKTNIRRLGDWSVFIALVMFHLGVFIAFLSCNSLEVKDDLIIFALAILFPLFLYFALKAVQSSSEDEVLRRGLSMVLFMIYFWIDGAFLWIFLESESIFIKGIFAHLIFSVLALTFFMIIEGLVSDGKKSTSYSISSFWFAIVLVLLFLIGCNYYHWESSIEKSSFFGYKLYKDRVKPVENPLAIHLIKNYPYAKDFAPKNQVVIENHLARVTPAKESANKAGVYRLELFDSHRLYFFYDSKDKSCPENTEEDKESKVKKKPKTYIWLTRTENKGGEYKEELIKTATSCDLGFDPQKPQEKQATAQTSPTPSGA